MNEVIQNILNRRSWRSYEDKQIKEEELEQIIRCGLWAPSAMNQQSWHFTVVQDKETIQRIRKGCQEMMETDRDMFYGAPTLVIVTGKQDNIAPVADCSLAIQNMFLSAASLGIGSCWINCIGRYLTTPQGQAFAKDAGIPEGYIGVAGVILGYPKGEAPQGKERAEGSVDYIR